MSIQVDPATGSTPAAFTPTYAGAPEAPTPPKAGKNGLAVAALAIGIVSIVMAVIPFVNYVAGFFAFIGLVLGIIALVLKNRAKKMAIVGVILNAVAGLLAIILAFAYTAAFVNAVDNSIDEANSVVEAPAAEEPAEAAPDAPAVGTRENPAPIGTTVTVQQAGVDTWQITPGAPTLNAAEAVAAANQFNDAAPEGYQWAMLPVTFTYLGDEAATPWTAMDFAFVGADGITYEEYNTLATGYVDGEVTSIADMYNGASATGNVLILVPSAGVEQGTWVVTPMFVGDPYFFAAQ